MLAWDGGFLLPGGVAGKDGGGERQAASLLENPARWVYKSGVAKLYDSGTGARVVIVSADHCPPHIHVAHKGEGWVVKLRFSFGSEAVGVLEIAPTEGAVRRKQLNQLLDELAGRLRDCRKLWWDGKGTTCLENQWLVRVRPGRWRMPGQQRAEAKQVKRADYDAAALTTRLTFWDGSEDAMESGEDG